MTNHFAISSDIVFSLKFDLSRFTGLAAQELNPLTAGAAYRPIRVFVFLLAH